MGPTGGPELDGAGRSESNEGDLAPRALEVIRPSEWGEEALSRSEYIWSGLPRPKRPDLVITHNFLPPWGPEPPRVEISAPGEEEVREILHRWEPFHRGASTADRLKSAYVSGTGGRLGHGPSRRLYGALPASTLKENFL